jgi:hypothetical protein
LTCSICFHPHWSQPCPHLTRIEAWPSFHLGTTEAKELWEFDKKFGRKWWILMKWCKVIVLWVVCDCQWVIRNSSRWISTWFIVASHFKTCIFDDFHVRSPTNCH